jgi:VWA_CoxE family protein
VVQIMQKDAIERLSLTSLLTEKEMLANVTPDVHLVATLMSLSRVIPEKNKALARQIVQRVVDELMKKLQAPTQQAVLGALNRATRTRNPRYREIDWHRTILKNLKNYQPDYQSIIPEVRIGYGRKRKAVRDLILCLDQSGSMGTSVIYSGIFGAVLASLPALQTRMVVFDTSVVDLSDQISDPVELLFGVQLGGGTDIDRALAYCQSQITRPTDTTLVLVTDLYEGGNERRMRQRMAELVASGVQFIVLLALNDDGAPFYDQQNAEYLASLGVPAFACTPDQFPDLMAAALNKQDLSLWVAENVKK